jgi:hypothetical protein
MRRLALSASLLAAVLLAMACATPPATPPPPERPGEPPRPQAPALGLFSQIKVPGGHDPVAQFAARGVQIFRCEREGTAYEWRFRQPEAELFDAQGQPVARHGANFSFEHRDGSRLIGSVVAHDKAPAADTLPWLLFSAKSYGKGEFGGISYVQRVNTRGGMPPRGCAAAQANKLLRVDFGADFVFYRPRG